MKWDPNHQSRYVEDRRGRRGSSSSGAASVIGFLFRRFGIKGAAIGVVGLLLVAWLGGADVLSVLGTNSGGAAVAPAGSDEGKAFISFVLDDIQTTWQAKRAQTGASYPPAHLVLFSGQTRSACGLGDAVTGPFYCPGDKKVYIDLSFYEALKNRLGAPGDFAQAYVIAHEIGHHLSHLDGALGKGRDQGADRGSVRVELQADCYAGVWAHSAKERQLLEVGDFEEAMRAAEAIGDDTLQKNAGGVVRPETFSHGTSEQRMRWFKRGFASGNPGDCDTFQATSL